MFKCIRKGCNNLVVKEGNRCHSCAMKERIVTDEWRRKISGTCKRKNMKPSSQKGNKVYWQKYFEVIINNKELINNV